jgi:dTDP-4-dehydrorhamnose 3,5-epimerase
MEFIERKLKGVIEISLKPLPDERGFFMRTFDTDLFEKAGICNKWVQENHSRSEYSGIIRGLHLQIPPFSESKLIRCIKGKIFDVFVDLRYGSDTFGQWDSIELSDNNSKMILIPRGFAHGFCIVSEKAEVLYKVDNYYSRENEVGIIWSDKNLAISWPVISPVLSEKDKKNITLNDFIDKYKAIRV